MMISFEELQVLIKKISLLMDNNLDLDPGYYDQLTRDPWVILKIIDLVLDINEQEIDNENTDYFACIFALEVCIEQLQVSSENGNILAKKALDELMLKISQSLPKHSLNFWLPILNLFYTTHIELSPELKYAYMNFASMEEDEYVLESEESYIASMRDLMAELSDLSVFDQAEHFFAQSYAMPAEFFAELLSDLYSLDEGHEVALLLLLHPNVYIREVVFDTLNAILPHIILSSKSLSRLQEIKYWYPKTSHAQFESWIKNQRHKGVIFHRGPAQKIIKLKASEIDGSGAQGVFIHIQDQKINKLCGLLLKASIGVKDAWMTPILTAMDVVNYYKEAFDDSVMLRDIDLDYLQLVVNHFVAITLEKDKIPPLHLLEIQEILGVQFVPKKMDIPLMLEKLTVEIYPFTQESINLALKHTYDWAKNKRFTESWYVENLQIDCIVNSYCSFVEGVKVCQIESAIKDVLANEFELHREDWLFHFLWVALWLKSRARKNESAWQDALLIAHVIYSDMLLIDIPIMHEICYQTVVNSMETMQERRTHLKQI